MTQNYFPDNFLWGSASAAYHFEGASNQDGKGPAVYDVVPGFQHIRVEKPEDEPNLKHIAVDFYNQYKTDVQLFAELGLKAFRTSINWSRIYPKGIETEANEKGLQFYDDLFDELIANGIEPIITLTHSGEMPLYLADNFNGFANKEVIDHYVKYVSTVVNRYKDKVKYWLTFNEVNGTPDMPFFYAGISEHPENLSDQEIHQVIFNLFLANSKAIAAIKSIDPTAMVGITTIQGPYYPMSSKPEDNLKAYKDNRDRLAYTDVHVFGEYPAYKLKLLEEKGVELDATDEEWKIIKQNTVDYLAYSYYLSGVSEVPDETAKKEEGVRRAVNVISEAENPYLEHNEWGWPIDPVGLRIIANMLHDRYGLPQFIVENGHSQIEELVEDEDGNLTVLDDYRINTLKQHLQQLNLALKDGANIIGYTNWAVMDFVSGTTGTMEKRWGFIYVNRHDDFTGDLKRYKKLSFNWYRDVIQTNGDKLLEN